jgi:hypothetical protein
MAQPQAMLLDFEELLVKGQRLRRSHRPRRRQFTLGVGQDFSEMTGSGHLHFRFWIFEFRLDLEKSDSIENRQSKFENYQSSIA